MATGSVTKDVDVVGEGLVGRGQFLGNGMGDFLQIVWAVECAALKKR